MIFKEKTFEQYEDGEWVFFQNNYHDPAYQFQAFKSKYTHNAFRLKNQHGEKIVDISEITPMKQEVDESLSIGHVDSDADSSGFYQAQD